MVRTAGVLRNPRHILGCSTVRRVTWACALLLQAHRRGGGCQRQAAHHLDPWWRGQHHRRAAVQQLRARHPAHRQQQRLRLRLQLRLFQRRSSGWRCCWRRAAGQHARGGRWLWRWQCWTGQAGHQLGQQAVSAGAVRDKGQVRMLIKGEANTSCWVQCRRTGCLWPAQKECHV